jgi:hypothetical protein
MTEEEWFQYLLKHRGHMKAASKLWHMLKTIPQYEGMLAIAALMEACVRRAKMPAQRRKKRLR